MDRTHDYRQAKRRWGHDIGFDSKDGGITLHAHGWGYADDANSSPWIATGDYLLLSHNDGSGHDARYRVEKIQYQSDPKDMWFATLTFAPRDKRSTPEDAASGTGRGEKLP